MATTNGIARRIEALEVVVQGGAVDVEGEREHEEKRRQREAARERLLDELGATMDVPRFVELTRPGATLDGQPIPEERVRHLWREIDLLCQQYSAGWLQQKFALHPAVVEALLRHGPPAWLLDGSCADCRLPLPYRLHLQGEGFGISTGERVFLQCPDCGSDDVRSMHGRVPRPLDGPREGSARWTR